MLTLNNLYNLSQPEENTEHFNTLMETQGCKIQTIRSWLKTPGKCYNQEEDELVFLINGAAKLEVEGEKHLLTKGDYCFIPKFTEHRVLETSSDALWIGVFSS